MSTSLHTTGGIQRLARHRTQPLANSNCLVTRMGLVVKAERNRKSIYVVLLFQPAFHKVGNMMKFRRGIDHPREDKRFAYRVEQNRAEQSMNQKQKNEKLYHIREAKHQTR
jgi:hypothetical protein